LIPPPWLPSFTACSSAIGSLNLIREKLEFASVDSGGDLWLIGPPRRE
jgi:hypothetical protein